jgi:hypothetical protein
LAIFNDIESAFTNQLATLTDAPDIAWPNINYKPKAGTAYIAGFMLPGEFVQASMGATGKDVQVGIFQVNVYVPAGIGRSALPDAIAEHFKRGTVLSYNGTSIRIRAASIGPAGVDGAWYIVPVSINYQTYTEAR